MGSVRNLFPNLGLAGSKFEMKKGMKKEKKKNHFRRRSEGFYYDTNGYS